MAGPLIQRIKLDRPKLPRNRQVRSCQSCRVCKIKCDRSKPRCQKCEASNRICIYITEQKDDTIKLNQYGHLTTKDDEIRYYASSSWVSEVEEPFGTQSLEFATHSFLKLEDVDRLVCWYIQFCQFWYPMIDIPELINSIIHLRNDKGAPAGASALIAAICYAAASSADSSEKSLGTASAWKELALRLLSESGYPIRANLNTIRAALLLATSSIADKTNPDPAPIAVLVRAGQSLGLHRDPASFQLSAREIEFRRIIWWSIHSMDMSYSLAHALPPMIQSASSDVQALSGDEIEKQLLKTIVKVNLWFYRVFEMVYFVRQPTRNDIQQLDEKATAFVEDEISNSLKGNPLQTFIGMSQRLCCYKLVFILHQPYLRSTHWPQSSRKKALDACQSYIIDFLAAVSNEYSPYHWVVQHFSVIHACAIILQDLIQHPKSEESLGLQGLVESCFTAFAKDEPIWEKLESLRLKAWAANEWVQDSLEIEASLSDWDPLFASFVWDDVTLESTT